MSLYFQQLKLFCIALILVFGCLLITPASHTATITNSPPKAQAAVIAQVVWVKGSLKASGSNQTSRALTRRSPIFLGDTLTTDKNGSGQIVFSDNSTLSLTEDSVFKIEKYKLMKGTDAKKSEFAANLVKGGFRTVTGLIPKNNPDNYQVNTPVATIGVRGTGYAVVYRGELWIKYYSGKPCVENKQGKSCLDSQNRYGKVTSDSSAPSTQTQAPEAFAKDIPLSEASFDTSAMTAPIGGGTGGKPGGGGTVSGFCIN
jgi:hypothetical protein